MGSVGSTSVRCRCAVGWWEKVGGECCGSSGYVGVGGWADGKAVAVGILVGVVGTEA